MRITEGGMRMPSVPPTASVPVESRFEYFSRFISGSATWLMVAAVATEEPQIEPNAAQATIAACATPPFLWPISVVAA
jgi:hypothetical protein